MKLERKELIILEIILIAIMFPIVVCNVPSRIFHNAALIFVDIVAMWLAIDKVYNLRR